jgi:hypothetical protein
MWLACGTRALKTKSMMEWLLVVFVVVIIIVIYATRRAPSATVRMDGAMWSRLPRDLKTLIMMEYVALYNCRTVRLCSKSLRDLCRPLYERRRAEQLRACMGYFDTITDVGLFKEFHFWVEGGECLGKFQLDGMRNWVIAWKRKRVLHVITRQEYRIVGARLDKASYWWFALLMRPFVVL